MAENLTEETIAGLYAAFDAPIAHLDCGAKCAPYNESGAPFCCDTRHAVPTAYSAEWDYLRARTDLWHIWQGSDAAQTAALQKETPAGQVLVECLGHTLCQRPFRSLTCRSFPFFPYISREGEFLGLSYYWAYEDRCWVISNLDQVSPAYLGEFIAAYERLFDAQPEEFRSFLYHATIMRRVFGRKKRAIPLLHRNGKWYKITPRNGRMRATPAASLPKFGPYAVTAWLTFADEV